MIVIVDILLFYFSSTIALPLARYFFIGNIWLNRIGMCSLDPRNDVPKSNHLGPQTDLSSM
jgi:hypothetical protein